MQLDQHKAGLGWWATCGWIRLANSPTRGGWCVAKLGWQVAKLGHMGSGPWTDPTQESSPWTNPVQLIWPAGLEAWVILSYRTCSTTNSPKSVEY